MRFNWLPRISFFLYSGHYIYITYDGFDFAIFIGVNEEEYNSDLLREYNTNYTFFKDFSKDHLDLFIRTQS